MKIGRRLLDMGKKNNTVANRLHREKGTNVDYDNLLSRPGPLKNKRYARDIFSLSLALGYRKGMRTALDKKDDFLNEENFGDILPSLIKALAITKSDQGIEVLSEDSQVIYAVAEEYANVGLEILGSMYINHEDEFIEELRLDIQDLNENNRIINKLNELNSKI